LDFQKLEISTSGPIQRPNMRHHTKFCEDRWNRSGDMADLRFFKIAAAAILDFGNLKFVTVVTLKRVEMRLHAKFCWNRSNRGWDMGFFDFSRWRPQPSWIFKSWKFQLPVPFWGPICDIIPHFAKIDETVPEMWPIYDFSRWLCRHLGFWKFEICNGCDAQEGRNASACQVLLKSLKPRLRYGIFRFFKMAASTILDFQKLEILTSGPILRPNMRHHTTFCEDQWNRSGDVANLRFFKVALPPSWILEIWNL